MQPEISASILGADMTNMKKLTDSLEDSGVDMLHYDVMDGIFVPNISFGIPILRDLNRCSNIFMDVHLMIQNPLNYIEQFRKAGADLITFHYESSSDVRKVLDKIKSCGALAGLAIKPKTSVEEILEYVKDFDLILVMTVEPGFGGQAFMQDMMPKVDKLYKYRKENKLSYKIQVDGGINERTAPIAAQNGVDVLVSGSCIMKSTDMKKTVKILRSTNKR